MTIYDCECCGASPAQLMGGLCDPFARCQACEAHMFLPEEEVETLPLMEGHRWTAVP